MDSLYKINGLMFWNEREILIRKHIKEYFDHQMRLIIRNINPAVDIREVETPTIMPMTLLSPSYTSKDVWQIDDFVMRAETTPGTYVYAVHLLNHKLIKPPFCLFQSGKSYRREDEHPTKFMRLREFYQMEFQWIYTSDTANDYHSVILEPVCNMIREMIGLPCRIVPSDRLPSYSEITTDIEVEVNDRWMELASISRRNDFPIKAEFSGKQGIISKDLLNVEIAIGLDRCVYAFDQRSGYGDSC